MITNREQLIQLRTEYKLNYTRIAELLGVSWYTVKSWLLTPSSEAHRGMSTEMLNKLKQKLK